MYDRQDGYRCDWCAQIIKDPFNDMVIVKHQHKGKLITHGHYHINCVPSD